MGTKSDAAEADKTSQDLENDSTACLFIMMAQHCEAREKKDRLTESQSRWGTVDARGAGKLGYSGPAMVHSPRHSILSTHELRAKSAIRRDTPCDMGNTRWRGPSVMASLSGIDFTQDNSRDTCVLANIQGLWIQHGASQF